ncbi:hypothetical protein Poli38472_005676 [Pythium oligandrum]|uniref:AAA+ ATPase domain-containing protein n=1 Tax=Pythium oligandrum TaxID=41045 RepID=A0A8K1FLV3_PYTOL|nr:hypothetical protein Poli38472_005676 [Pythium oligandrum]|eukprot:TMW63058.1 hypothetical protein Poli38472_005676 [Pythium oligandrum]
MAMADDDVYAYEQEFEEMDEWEAMHEHELEAAEEELRAMEAAEAAAAAKRPESRDEPDEPMDVEEEEPDHFAALDDKLAQTQERVRSVLERCAEALGESEDAMEVTEPAEDVVVHKQKTGFVDTTTANYLFSRPPIDVDSMSIVLPTGERKFLRKRSVFDATARSSSASAVSKSLIPITAMMEALEQRQIESAVKADARPATREHAESKTGQQSNVLWLDKYKPQRFIDLLSDERTNREVLGWIKQWDRFVFPNKKQSHPPVETATPSFGKPGQYGKNADASGAAAGVDTNDPRPREKIILLCGPPGAGKSTLASIVARHAGYNPIEVNASDDRTAGVLKNKIISAMEMQSIWGDRKPNCIILDEIDGAMNSGDGKSAIAAIQEIISAPLNSNKDAKNGKRTKSSQHPLTRPLICICNDQFASVLRPLRKLAKIFVLDPPNSQRLVTRLKFICRSEGLRSTTGVLASLCANGGNDVRYCVNALQFQSTQTKHITSTAVASGLIGQKDHSRGVFETMDMVFYKAKSKSSSKAAPIMDQIDEAAQSLGNFPLLINALDENLPKMMYNDPTMNKICDAFEWMGIADAWDLKARSEQQFAFMAYVPFAARAVHLVCCTSSRRRIEYPKSHAEAHKKHEQSTNILRALVENSLLQPSMRQSADVLVVDVVPWLLATLSPSIRHINPSLQTADEKVMIQRLIELMASLGLSFRPKYLPDGTEDYALEPAVNELVRFRHQDSGNASSMVLPLPVRKMITREVELEQMRKSENSERGPRGRRTKAPSDLNQDAAEGAQSKPTKASQQFVLPTLTEQQVADKLEIMRKRNPFAFAHREAKRKRDEALKELEQTEEAEDTLMTKKRPSVRYRYNEGYTSGIKTTVFMKDLL